MPKAEMLDVDGTSVDSMALHAEVWMDTFHDFGHEAGFDDARGQIGKSGGRPPPVFLSEEDVERNGAPSQPSARQRRDC